MNIYVDEKGFTLVEVIISITILGILIIPIFTLMSINIKLSSESIKQIKATNFAESKIEELKFSETIKSGNNTIEKDGFKIESLIEPIYSLENDKDKKNAINSSKLYRITVEVIKNDKVIEKLLTYKSSLERSDSN